MNCFFRKTQLDNVDIINRENKSDRRLQDKGSDGARKQPDNGKLLQKSALHTDLLKDFAPGMQDKEERQRLSQIIRELQTDFSRVKSENEKMLMTIKVLSDLRSAIAIVDLFVVADIAIRLNGCKVSDHRRI